MRIDAGQNSSNWLAPGSEEPDRLVALFVKLFEHREVALFFVSKVLPPYEKIEVEEGPERTRVKIHCAKREGKIEQVEEGGYKTMIGASLTAGSVVEGTLDFREKKFVFDPKNGLAGTKGILKLGIKEVKLDSNKQVIISPDSWIIPAHSYFFETIRCSLNCIRWH